MDAWEPSSPVAKLAAIPPSKGDDERDRAKKWDLLGYDNADRRTMKQGVDKTEIKEIREDKNLRAYHLFPASGNTRHETYLRNNLSYERWNARDFFFTYVLDHNVKRIPTSADVLSHPLT